MIHKIRFHSKKVIEKDVENTVNNNDDQIIKAEKSAEFEKNCYDVIMATIAPELLVTVEEKTTKRVAVIDAVGTRTKFRFTPLFSALARRGFLLDELGKKFGVSILRLHIFT